jgi:outer membrane protein OmpA-like peptidoglycan-associated protein
MLPAAALAQNAPALSAEQIADMLSPGASSSVAYSADDLAAILAPPTGATRSLKGGGEPAAPGQPTSGVVPDLKINFASGKATISPAARAQLDELGRALQFPQLSGLQFVIAGHTDAAGSAEMNQRLSERRAQAVVEYLVEGYSIPPDRLEAEGWGKTKLLDPARPTSGVNRRVEVRAQR